MAALDTNVLVRFLMEDDDVQTARARRLVTNAATAGVPLFVPMTVALELEWVLRSRYGFSKVEIIGTLGSLLSTNELSFDAEDVLELALVLYSGGTADFSDCIHTALAQRAGQSPLWTFDKAAAKLADTRLPAG